MASESSELQSDPRADASNDENDDFDADAFWMNALTRDYERARSMGLVEPTWLPETVLQEYADFAGIQRRPKTDPEHVRARMKNFRLERRITQQELAQRMGVSQSAVSRFERGRRAMRLHQLTRLAEALDVPLWALVRRSDTADDA